MHLISWSPLIPHHFYDEKERWTHATLAPRCGHHTTHGYKHITRADVRPCKKSLAWHDRYLPRQNSGNLLKWELLTATVPHANGEKFSSRDMCMSKIYSREAVPKYGRGARAPYPTIFPEILTRWSLLWAKFQIPVARQWGREMTDHTPYVTNPFHSLSSFHNTYQFIYIYRTFQCVLTRREFEQMK